MKHAKAVRRIIFTVLIVAAVIVGFNTYTADYYHAKDYELQTTEVSETDAYIAYGGASDTFGFIPEWRGLYHPDQREYQGADAAADGGG